MVVALPIFSIRLHAGCLRLFFKSATPLYIRLQSFVNTVFEFSDDFSIIFRSFSVLQGILS